MVWQRIRFALLAGALAAVAAHPAQAGDCCAPAPAKFCTIKVWECVPETYTTTRTVYKTECRTEQVTCYKCECVPEQKTCTYTVYKKVPECKTVTRTYCVCIPVCEEKTIMKPCWTKQQVTKMVCKTEDHGHYECREVPCKKHHHKHHKKHCCGDCCDCCECECIPTKTVKCWVPCKVTVQVPVCCWEKVCVMKPCVVKCVSYKKEMRTETCQVTCYKCVPEVCTRTITVYTTRKVPYQTTRTVQVCVPCQEQVTCTRMVKRCVEKQVPVCECCAPCCPPPCCEVKCKKHKHHHKHHKCCCEPCCCD